jgi:hypothetical protein
MVSDAYAHRCRRVRPRLLAVLAACPVIALTVLGVLFAAGPAAAAPSVTVAPSGGLTNGQRVTVTGSRLRVVPLIVVERAGSRTDPGKRQIVRSAQLRFGAAVTTGTAPTAATTSGPASRPWISDPPAARAAADPATQTPTAIGGDNTAPTAPTGLPTGANTGQAVPRHVSAVTAVLAGLAVLLALFGGVLYLRRTHGHTR